MKAKREQNGSNDIEWEETLPIGIFEFAYNSFLAFIVFLLYMRT